ncbi:unnamed protein product, partial [Iphiclides podalirius]
MSTLQNPVWSKIPGESLNPKYEKCRNITEEIYKRINITFQIKKLEGTGTQSDLSDCSDQIDSNELSNETDLFACDKSSLSSSTDPDRALTTCEKYININNNEETKINKTVCKRPRKKFRKRVKKHQSIRNRSDSDGSSDEAIPLSRVDVDTRNSQSESPDNVMGVPNIVIVTKDVKGKLKSPASQKAVTKQTKQRADTQASPPQINTRNEDAENVTSENCDKAAISNKDAVQMDAQEWRYCPICNLSFRGECGLRRHMTLSHKGTEEHKKTGDGRDLKAA